MEKVGLLLSETVLYGGFASKVEKKLKGSLDLIPSPSPFSEKPNYERESLFEV